MLFMLKDPVIKMLRKFTSLILAILLIASLCITAYAAELSISSDVKTVSKGDTVKLTVSLSGCADANTMGISISYNKNQFSLESGDWIINGLLSDFDESMNKGVFAVADKSASFNGDVFELTLKAKDDSFDTSSISADLIVRNDSTTVANISATVSISGKGTHSHTIQYVPDVLADCKNSGMLDYYYCTVCQKAFYDAFGAMEITNLNDLFVKPNDSHTFVNGICIVCSAVENDVPAVDDDDVPAVDDDDIPAVDDGEDEDVVESICEHEFGDRWHSNETYHWQECTECEESSDKKRHEASSSGSKGEEVTCTVCGYLIKKAEPVQTEAETTESIVTTTEPTQAETTATTTTPSQTESEATTTQPTTSEEAITSDAVSESLPENDQPTYDEEPGLPADTNTDDGRGVILTVAIIAVTAVLGTTIGLVFYKKKIG